MYGEDKNGQFWCLNSSLSLLYFYFVTNLQKQKYGERTLTAEPPPSPYTSQCALTWTNPPSQRAYFMDDPFPEVHLKVYFEEIIRITYFGIDKNCKFILSLQYYKEKTVFYISVL